MIEETLDIYDEDMNHLGTAPRKQVHEEGMWHTVFHCWIVNQPNKVWLQFRSSKRSSNPNKLSVSVAGHLQAGESPKDGIREIEEELGLKVDINKLVKLFTSKKIDNYPGYHNCEFNPTYLLESNVELQSLKLQPNEVGGIFKADIEDLVNLFEEKVKEIKITGILLNYDNTFTYENRYVSTSDFAPHNNYLKVMQAIKRYFDGVKETE